MFQLAVIAALRQNKDEAFDWLLKAKTIRKVDMTQVEVTPELASLKGDARPAGTEGTPTPFEIVGVVSI